MTGSKRPGKGTAIIVWLQRGSKCSTNRVQRICSRQGKQHSRRSRGAYRGVVSSRFYNNPYNIIALEILSKMFYPTRDLQTWIRWRITTPDFNFTHIPDDNIILSISPR